MPVTLLLASGHGGIVPVRTGFALSDVALFVMAAAAVWLARRALRRRFRARDPDEREAGRDRD